MRPIRSENRNHVRPERQKGAIQETHLRLPAKQCDLDRSGVFCARVVEISSSLQFSDFPEICPLLRGSGKLMILRIPVTVLIFNKFLRVSRVLKRLMALFFSHFALPADATSEAGPPIVVDGKIEYDLNLTYHRNSLVNVRISKSS